MDAETARILRQILMILAEQNELLRGYANVEAIRQMNQHVYLYHAGRQQPRRGPSEIEDALRRTRERIQELYNGLQEAPITAT